MIQYQSQRKCYQLSIRTVRKANLLRGRTVLFAKLNFATHCKSEICATPSNTRIFASDLVFGDFRAILRGVFVKKIHIVIEENVVSLPIESRNHDDKKIIDATFGVYNCWNGLFRHF